MGPNRTSSCNLPKLVSFVPQCKKDDFSSTALNIQFCQRVSKTPMEALEMLSKVYGESTIERSRFTDGIGVLKRVENPSQTMNVMDDIRTSRNVENVELVSECFRKDRLQTLAQIAESTHFLKTSFERIHLS
ncbi:hypothetical protein TNCV_1043931 [Trichonephila clavipes]|nr:hypothetical protein TNCV_1043931 [Trichonephila clavipes]